MQRTRKEENLAKKSSKAIRAPHKTRYEGGEQRSG